METKPKSSSSSGIGQPSQWTDREQKLWVTLLCLGSILLYAGRGALPVSMVEMSLELEWDKRTSGVVLSSFYWGYTMTQVVGGQLADRHGGELIVWMFGLGWSLALLGISLLAVFSNFLVMMCSFVSGLCQGTFFPALTTIMTARVITEKRSFFTGVISAGAQLGSMLVALLAYLFVFQHGWEYLFFTLGTVSVAWSLTIRWLSRRHEHRMHYRLLGEHASSNGNRDKINVHFEKGEARCIEVPWQQLFRQRSVLAMFYSFFCQGFFLHCLMAWIPTFFHETFPDMQHQAWLYNMAPWVGKAFSNVIGGIVADRLISKGHDVTYVRKLMEGISHVGAGTCLFLMGGMGMSFYRFSYSLVLMFFAFFCHGFEVIGSGLNPTDLTSSYSGVVFGLMNSFGAFSGIFGISLIGHILHSYENWSLVFFLISAINFSGFIVYTCFGSAKRLTQFDA